MSPNAGIERKQCFECRFEAVADDGEWVTTVHPSLGPLTQCPECGSTNIHSVE